MYNVEHLKNSLANCRRLRGSVLGIVGLGRVGKLTI